MLFVRIIASSLVLVSHLSANSTICTEKFNRDKAFSEDLPKYFYCNEPNCGNQEGKSWYYRLFRYPLTLPERLQHVIMRYFSPELQIICGTDTNVTLPLEYKHKQYYSDGPISLKIKHLVGGILPYGAFKNSNDTSRLYLNGLGIKYISEGTFEGLEFCDEIYLSGNNIKEIKPGVFNGLGNLSILDLSSNNIKDLNNFVLDIPKDNVLVLNLSYNAITELNKEQYEGTFKNLSSLDLSFNQVSDFNFDYINENLLSIDISHNRLSNINGCIYKILQVVLSHNNIKNIYYKCSKENLNINHLDLSHNQISTLNFDSFPNNVAMKSLLLQFNDISNLSMGTFSNLMHLQTLNLSYNKISVIPRSSFESLESLQYLDLSNNRLKKLDLRTLHALKSLELLYIQNNMIDDFDHERLINTFPNLKTINLDGNNYCCNSLLEKIFYLVDRGVDVLYGTNKYGTNVRGVACYKKDTIKCPNARENTTVKMELATTNEIYYQQVIMFYIAVVLLTILLFILAFQMYILYFKCHFRAIENVELM